MRSVLPSVLLAVAIPAQGQGPTHIEWSTDFTAAKAQAAAAGKDLLINFTGSDWCHWCVQLESEVFAKPAFVEHAGDQFVFVMADFPQNKKLPKELVDQNAELQQRFAVEGFPTILLTDSAGRSYAKTGYREGGAAAYVKHLDELRAVRKQRDELLARAKKAQGAARAKLLDRALTLVDERGLLVGYGAVIDEIKNLDADNTAGLAKKWTSWAALQGVQKAVEAAMENGAFDQALAVVDDALKNHDPRGVKKQDLLLQKAMILGNAKGDTSGATRTVAAALAAAPDSAKAAQLRALLERLKKMYGDPEAKKGTEAPKKGAK